jgi:phosphotriesterase-related protein
MAQNKAADAKTLKKAAKAQAAASARGGRGAAKRKTVMTARGPVAPEELGFTTMHEHIMFQGQVLARRMRKGIPANKLPIDENEKVSLANVGLLLRNSIMCWDALVQDDEDVMAGECEDYRNSGGGTIVEVSVPGLTAELDMSALRRVSERTGVHVVASTGFYTWDSWPERFRGLPLSGYKRHMEEEIRYGVEGTDIRPGSLKIALEDLNEMEENALRAAAQLCGETGLPLTIHPCGRVGGRRMQVLRILKEEGVDLSRVVFAHGNGESRPASFREAVYNPSCYRVDTSALRAILDEGANMSFELLNPLGFEMMGTGRYGDFGKLAAVYDLIRQGYAGQIVFGNDVCGRTMLRRGGALGYLRLTTFFIPSLRDHAGVPESTIRQMTVENPARILAV